VLSVLAFVAGAVDTTTFLSLSGLFAAHVTGNLVILGATLVLHHPQGVWSKVLALPVFVASVWGVSGTVDLLRQRGSDMPRLLLGAELVLLCLGLAWFAVFGPFRDADTARALPAGMILVAAMAVQNALNVIALPNGPPTTVMTSNMTRLFVDLATLVVGRNTALEERARLRQQSAQLAAAGSAFLLGCAAATLGHIVMGVWSLAIPTICVAGAWARYTA
jgi:uncharacterized membrane protein YoaK (UPF0700 family)